MKCNDRRCKNEKFKVEVISEQGHESLNNTNNILK